MNYKKKDILSDKLLLYAVTDRHWLGDRTLYDVVRESLEGGVTFLQLREKELDEDHFFEEAVQLQALARTYDVPFVVNDNVDIAVRMNADGVHVGQSDMEAGNVRALIGPDKILGVSAQTVEQAILAEKRGADYLGVGAVFPTGSKDDAEDVSYDTLKAICEAVSIPVVAIGGITLDNTPSLAGSGICGIAVISAIYAQKDIKEAAAKLKNVCIDALKETGDGSSSPSRGDRGRFFVSSGSSVSGDQKETKNRPLSPKGVIFDIDGVLLDSLGIWKNLGAKYLIKKGKKPEEGLNDILFPMSMEQGAEYLKSHYLPDMTQEEILEGIKEMLKEFYYKEAQAKPGMEKLLKALHSSGIRITAATSSPRSHVEKALKRTGLIRYIDRIYTNSEIGSSKHSPEIYDTATDFMGLTRAETCVFEDSLYALETASKAGYHTVGVYDENGETDQRGLEDTAEIYVKDTKELPELWEEWFPFQWKE